ncbi:MAG: FAD-dependent oxidoreductase, partial [Bacteriovoracaceae bacterium]|nr:FAD-dependent oxidoreductase [Bacteriovoracaceae bacterium]
TGPFTDQLLKKLQVDWEPKMILSKGSHLWLKKQSLELSHPMVLQTKDNRVIFVIPQRDAILIGTTEKALDANENIFNIQASEDEISYLLDAVNQYFPSAGVKEEDIISTFAGVRPLVAEKGKERGKVSRQHKIFSPDKNMYVVVGGKYTTFRVMAEDVVEMMFKDQGKKFKHDLSLRPLKKRSIVGMYPKDQDIDEEKIKRILIDERPKTSEDIIKRRLSMLDASQLKMSQAQLERIIKDFKSDS